MSQQPAGRGLSREVVLDLARRLGPASLEVIEDPRFLERVEMRCELGGRPEREDAVLGELFEQARTNGRLAEEFLRFVARDLAALPRRELSPRLRRLMDPNDLVQSVLGDLCTSLAGLRYESRAQFLAQLARRVRWKLLDHEKRLVRVRRAEDRRVEPAVADAAVQRGPSPATAAIGREEAGRIALAIAALPERDRELLRLQLRGDDAESAALRVGLSSNAARKALQRARERLRATLGRSLP